MCTRDGNGPGWPAGQVGLTPVRMKNGLGARTSVKIYLLLRQAFKAILEKKFKFWTHVKTKFLLWSPYETKKVEEMPVFTIPFSIFPPFC